MNIDKITFILALTALFGKAKAQTVIEGTVTDSLGVAVDAYVTVSPKTSLPRGDEREAIIGFANTDAKGYYQLQFRSGADSVVVTAAGMAIGNVSRIVANRSQRLDIRARQKAFELKEVSVKADKIRQQGDTLNYTVGAYQQQGDRVIGDVLKRMPGIEVSESGAIKFNGKAIKKFYVEDMDLLQGRYGLATNNINASDVATVQVLEHHQPIKALQDKSITDDVAINLKLKNSAKGTVAVNTMVGAGWQRPTPNPSRDGGEASGLSGNNSAQLPPPFTGGVGGGSLLWTAEVVGMYFAKRRQNMTLYKGNNAGEDVSKELTSHYSSINSVGLYPFCPTNAVLPNGSGLPQKRTFDNHSHIATVNHLEKVGKDSEVTMNIAYHHDDIRREGTSESDRFVSDDSRLLTTETLTSRTHLNDLSGNLRYMWNAKDGFLANVIKFDGSWNNDEVEGVTTYRPTPNPSREGGASSGLNGDDTAQPLPSITGGGGSVHQHFNRPSLAVSNTTNLIKNIGKHTLDLHFSAGYAQRPNTLMVGVDSLNAQQEVFNSHVYQQDIESRHINANFHTNYNFRFGYFTLAYGVIANASLHGIETELKRPTPNPSREGGASSGLQENDTAQPLPSITGGVGGGSALLNNLWYNTYELTLGQHYKWERGGWRISLGCPLNLYTQTLDDRIRDDKHSYTHLLVSPNFSTNYEWRDWSGNINASYHRNVGDPGGIYSGYIMSNYRTFQRSYVEQLSETDRVGAGASIGYRSALNALFFRINANYNHTRDNQIYGYTYEGATSVVQAVDQATTSDSYNLNFDFSKGFDWLQTTVRAFGGYGHSHSEQLIAGQLYPFNSCTISLGAGGTITPLPWLNFVLSSGYSWNSSWTDSNSSPRGGWEGASVRTATQRLSMNVYITKQMTLMASVEDNYTNLTAENRHAWFGDIKAKYKLGRCDLELQMNNLFDQRHYTRVTYSGLDIYTNTSQLRSRNILATVRFKLL